MRIHYLLLAFALALTHAAHVWAQTGVQFSYTQTDASTGSGTVSGMFDTTGLGGPGVLNLTGTLPSATVIQKGPAIAQPIPANAVGYINTADGGISGANTGVHLGFSGTVTLSAQSGNQIFEVDVPLILHSGASSEMAYSFSVFEDNSGAGGTNNAVGNPRFAGWPGDNLSGHRHTDGNVNFGAGAAVAGLASASFDLGGNSDGDDLGFTAGIRDNFTAGDIIFIDDITFGSDSPTSIALQADDSTLRVTTIPEPATIGIWALLGAIGCVGAAYAQRKRA